MSFGLVPLVLLPVANILWALLLSRRTIERFGASVSTRLLSAALVLLALGPFLIALFAVLLDSIKSSGDEKTIAWSIKFFLASVFSVVASFVLNLVLQIFHFWRREEV
ncbi:MAG: hypothetical protein AAF679_07370 [Pseudomonadota bacterium]